MARLTDFHRQQTRSTLKLKWIMRQTWLKISLLINTLWIHENTSTAGNAIFPVGSCQFTDIIIIDNYTLSDLTHGYDHV
jgi:hypothetical protein